MNATYPDRVDGVLLENIAAVEISGGGVAFDSPAQPYWGRWCLNVTGTRSHVSVRPGWQCRNETD